MPVTRIKNNQITDLTVNAAAKLQDFSITSGKIANNLTYNSSLTIAGNLTVQGNVTAIDTHDLVVEDPLILLAKDQTGSPTLDIGFIGERGDDINIAFVWKQNEGQFVTAFTNDNLTNTTITINSYANFQTNDITANNADLSGALDVSGNVTIANISIAGDSVIDAGNNIISNVAEPVANNDAATKAYVDQQSASGFTIEDDAANTTIVSGGDTLTLLGTADQVTVLITNTDEVTFGLPDNVVIQDNLSVTSTANVGSLESQGNITGANLSVTGDVAGNTGTFTGNVSADTFLGNIDGATGVFTGNVSGDTFLGNIDGATGEFTGNVSGDTFLGNIDGATGVFTGNVSGDTFLGNIDGATGVFTGNVSADTFLGNIDGATGEFTGNVSGDTFLGNIDGATGVFTGNVSGDTFLGNIDGATGVFTGNVSADTFLGNIDGATGVFTGNVSGDTFLGNIDGATGEFTGNVDAANVNATLVSSTDVIVSGNVDAGIVNTDNITAATDLTITATNVLLGITGNLDMNGRYIVDLADPTQAHDAATKQYVDDMVSTGITIHTPVRVETPSSEGSLNATYAQGGNTYTVSDTIAGNTVVFSTAANLQVNDQLWFSNSFQGIVANVAYFVVSTPNTSAAVLSTTYSGVPVSNITSASGLTEGVRVNSGQGATLTNAGANAALVIDGITVTTNDRVLVYNQTNGFENGVYDVTVPGDAGNAWVLTRSSDMNTYIPDNINGVDAGDYFFVEEGNTGAGESYVMTAPVGPVVIGYDTLTFTQFSASSTYSANTQAGLTLTGTIFSAKVDNNTTAFDIGGNISVKASANLTTPNIGNATGNSLTLTGNGLLSATTVDATGNIVANNIVANNDISTVTVTASGNVSGDTFLGNIDGATGTFSGNVTVDTLLGNIDGATGTFSGNVTVDTLLGNIDGATGTFSGNVTVDTLLGNIDGATGTFSGNVTADYFLGNIDGDTGTFSGNVTADYFLGNIDGDTGTFSGNVTVDTLLGNIDGATGTFSGNVTADYFLGNIDGDTGTFSGNVTVDTLLGNIDGATGTFSGNVTADTLLGNIDGATGTFSGNVTADTFIGNVAGGNISGNISAGGSNTYVQFNDDGILNGAAGFTFDQTTNQVTVTGNVDAGNVNATDDVTANNVSVTETISGNLLDVSFANIANIRISGDNITSVNGIVTINDALADVDFVVNGGFTSNLLYVDAGIESVVVGSGNVVSNVKFRVDSTDSIMVPVGNTDQRPAVGVTGMLRFNTSIDTLEYYDSDSWETVTTDFTVITANTQTGDGSTVAFTLPVAATTASTLVAINGVVQLPTTAYAVAGNVCTFTEAPEATDVIDFRILTTSTTVTGLAGDGGSSIELSPTVADIDFTGNLIPTANVTFDLGNSTNYWNNLYLAGNTIYLGSLQLKEINATTFGVFQSDGTTTADLDVGNIDVAALSQGTSTIGISGINGNAYVTVGGTANVLVVSTAGANVTGTLGVTGNIAGNYILGNGSQLTGIDATSIQNGTANVRTFLNGNVTTSAAGTANVLIVTGTGANVTGTLDVTGNITAGNLSGTNISGTLTTAAQTNVTSVGTLTSLAVTGNITAGNVSGTLLTGTLTTAAQPNVTSVGTLTSLAVTGNVSGGNLSTAGNVTGAVLKTANIFIDADTIHSANSTITIDPSAPGVTGLVVIAGNLQVQGTTTTIDSTTITVNDLQINVANNAATAAAANDAGLGVGPVGSEYAKWIYQNVGNVWSTAIGITASGNITGGNLSGTNITGTLTTAAQPNITSVGTLGSLTVTGNITGGNLITAGLVSLSSITKTGSNGAGNIGQSDNTFNTIFAKATSAQYADLAEMYEADAAIEPGTVVAFGGVKEVTVSFVSGDTRVAGVISTNPSFIMNSALEGDHPVAVALTGRVPTRVTGAVRKGDMMVSAGDGTACACAAPQLGTVIGKALEDHDGESGVIEVVVGRI